MADGIRRNGHTRRMGYGRIERVTGGAASFAALCNMTQI